jgi:hypothetical protein
MSGAALAARTGGAATQTLRQTESDVVKWLREVLDGNGSSPAQMIITTVLGCIPYVGQALDARNIILALVALSDDPDNGDKWLDLVLGLIALVPGFGDALKNVFKLLRVGKPMGRILDALPASLRGNIERWFRTLDWARYTRDLSSLTDTMLGKLIDVLDGWVTRAVMGNARVRQLVAQLRHIKSLAHRKIDEVMRSLQAQHRLAVATPLPSTSASTRAASNSAPRVSTPGSSSAGNVRRTTQGTHTPPQGNVNGGQRQSPPRRSNRRTGASAEHITDYYFVKRNKSRQKVSNRGQLWEYDAPHHHNIDHIWHHDRLPFKYRVTDTKGTSRVLHRLMTPKAFYEAARMGVDAYMGSQDESSVRNATPRATVGDGKEMSHRWVVAKVRQSDLIAAHRVELEAAVAAWRRGFAKDINGVWRLSGKAPYDRSLVPVVKANIDAHDNARGANLPRCAKPVKVHQIAAEFILATEMYFE